MKRFLIAVISILFVFSCAQKVVKKDSSKEIQQKEASEAFEELEKE